MPCKVKYGSVNTGSRYYALLRLQWVSYEQQQFLLPHKKRDCLFQTPAFVDT